MLYNNISTSLHADNNITAGSITTAVQLLPSKLYVG